LVFSVTFLFLIILVWGFSPVLGTDAVKNNIQQERETEALVFYPEDQEKSLGWEVNNIKKKGGNLKWFHRVLHKILSSHPTHTFIGLTYNNIPNIVSKLL
jgi:hypothetical protein